MSQHTLMITHRGETVVFNTNGRYTAEEVADAAAQTALKLSRYKERATADFIGKYLELPWIDSDIPPMIYMLDTAFTVSNGKQFGTIKTERGYQIICIDNHKRTKVLCEVV